MPFRKDHLQLVTDAGATLDIGWAYGTPYSLDPINGVDVDVQTAQGVNQVGVSVECQSVAGVSRELIITATAPTAMRMRNYCWKSCPISPAAQCILWINSSAVLCFPRPPTQRASTPTRCWISCSSARNPSGTT